MWLLVISYIGFVAFVVFFVVRAVKYQRTPVHLRWELYPIPGESERKYGGSYMEDFEWWDHEHKRSLLGEIVYMVSEILMFSEYRHRNKGYWYFVLPFHIGGYLVVTWLALLIVSAITMAAGQEVASGTSAANGWGILLYYLTLIIGVAGFIIGGLGCLGLIYKRITDENLSLYTTRFDYFTLLVILAIFITGIISWASTGLDFAYARAYMEGLVTADSVSGIGAALTIQMLLLAILAAYMPFTPMMHYIAKHFTFNKVRWNDHPNTKGSKLEHDVKAVLTQTMTWSAPHIQSGKTWAEVVTSEVPAEEKQS